ncbi:MAG: hypothetical protein KatS3mg010_0765 [Acidimicrobiia bacterium]|nr:MAG: hypothetical protein KatS3mg010_0765 [Acidimicrobiia bacterium]
MRTISTAWSTTRPLLVGHVDDAEVDVGGEAAVQRDLAFAVAPARLGGRQVDERERDRLLALEDAIADERDARDVRLDQLDRLAGPHPRQPVAERVGHGAMVPERERSPKGSNVIGIFWSPAPAVCVPVPLGSRRRDFFPVRSAAGAGEDRRAGEGSAV